MLRTRLLTATAAIALFGAGSVFAQDATAPAAPPTRSAPATVPDEAVAPPQAATPAAANTVIDVLASNGQFTTLLAALEAAQLTDTLKTQPAISIFAPTDAAFAALSEEDRTRLMDPANVNELRQLLLYHVVVADVNSSQIEGTKGGVETAARTQVQLDGTGSAIKVDEATVTTADIEASNGAIFAIDRVLNPADSQVAAGDADEDAAAAVDDTTTEAPPADAAMDEATPPTDETMTGDDMDNDPATTDGETTPPPVDGQTDAPVSTPQS
ncbi:fasciclin domain-containing protein [Brevundimonas subvibrioides]|uniref:fasciclin domain-containing protein n=1 Tax=Brevundimonas subvibrioides TaxID=74313 RepID=UPI0022B2B86F|nr:fasciclin domain-containing protein [Brevundimonas subvibrioides]